MAKKAGFFQFKLKGVQKQRRRFKDAVAATKKVVRQAVRDAAKVIQVEARALAPKKTGTLRKGIVVRAGKRKKGAISAVVTFNKSAYYGPAVEKGHKNRRGGGMTPAHPFLRPAYDTRKGQSAQVVIDAVKNEIKRV